MNETLQTAVIMVETGQTEEGLKQLKTILPTADDDTKFQIASHFQSWGLIDDAISVFSVLAEKYPNDSHLILQLAENSIENDDEERAIDWLDRIHPLDENYLSAQVLLADLYQSQGLEEVAERKLINARKAAPDEPVLTFALAEFYLSSGQASLAIPLYKKVLHEESLLHENIYLKLAEALSLNGKFEEAMIYYDKGMQNHPPLDAYFGYGMTAFQAQKYQTAIKYLEKLKDMDEQYTSLYPVLAEAYEQEGMFEEALSILDKGILTDEHNSRLYFNAAQLSLKSNNENNAAVYLQRLLKLDPENVEARKQFIGILVKQEDYDSVITHLQDGHDDPVLTWYLARAYKEMEEDKQAIVLYQSIDQEFKEDPVFLYEYGELLWQMGNRENALHLLKSALEKDPGNDVLASFVERIEQDF